MRKWLAATVLLACIGATVACERAQPQFGHTAVEGSIAQQLETAQEALFDALRGKDRVRLSAFLHPSFRWVYVQPDSTVLNGLRPTIINYAQVLRGEYPDAFTAERSDLAVEDTLAPASPQVIARSRTDASVVYTRWRRGADGWVATGMVRLPWEPADSGPTM